MEAQKILVRNPVVEMSGEGKSREVWDQVKEKIICRHLDLTLLTHDLSLKNRDATCDGVTRAAAADIQKHKVGVKCATVTPDADLSRELGLKNEIMSANIVIRDILKVPLPPSSISPAYPP